MSFKVYMLGRIKLQAHDDGQITAICIVDWKPVYMEHRAKGMMVWNEPFVEPALAQAIQTAAGSPLRFDDSSITYWDWVLDHVPGIYAAQALTAQQLVSFGDFPPRQNPTSFNLDSLLEKMRQATDGNLHKSKYLCLRSYGPQEPVLTDEWTPPHSNGWTESNPLLTWRSMPEI